MALEPRTRVSSCLGLVSWMYLHLRVDVHSGTRTHYRSLQTLTSPKQDEKRVLDSTASHYPSLLIMLVN
ncbi:unnamed protein product [Schistosoma margrebowiei]|uniref:Uncharacterized protein n=1 Tax=Schistosoma margrebowiei TaxID=48269 RepID=A0A3P8FJ08_9TREM|nr:unnamed protein product [Schistosoma margrebowiei]